MFDIFVIVIQARPCIIIKVPLEAKQGHDPLNIEINERTSIEFTGYGIGSYNWTESIFFFKG